MSQQSMVVNGHGAEALLLKVLQLVGVEQGAKDSIIIQPALVGWESKAPTRKRKFAELKLKLGLSPDLFREPESINYVDPIVEGVDLVVFMAIDKRRFNAEGLRVAEESGSNFIARHPELAELLDDFLPKWKAAYARAIAAEKDGDGA